MLLALLSLISFCAAYNISCHQLTVSGISAGGYMAAQFHVANSNSVSGSAVFAGGPFYCAQNDLAIALSSCMKDPELIAVDELKTFADGFAVSGEIDSLDGLGDDVVFLYSGVEDTVVHPKVVMKAGEFFSSYGATVHSVYNISSEHCVPTRTYGNDCSVLASPFLSKCNFDGAGAALNTLLSLSEPPAPAPVLANFLTMDQKKFFPPDEVVLGMADSGYVYVPTSCQQGEACRVHVDWHGCEQGEEFVGMTYVQHVGYAQWAETNHLIVLFPQGKKDLVVNPKGCFDWWGYSAPYYPWKSAPQMMTVQNMVDFLQRDGNFLKH